MNNHELFALILISQAKTRLALEVAANRYDCEEVEFLYRKPLNRLVEMLEEKKAAYPEYFSEQIKQPIEA